MKKIVKGVVLPVVIAIIMGYIGGKYVYKIYRDNLSKDLSSSRVYLIENGEYDSIDTMREDNSRNNYVYYFDNNKYKSVVGITKNYDNIEKIKSLYDDKLSVLEYYVANYMLDTKQDIYEEELKEASDINDVKKAVDNILSLYRNDDNIKLIMVN